MEFSNNSTFIQQLLSSDWSKMVIPWYITIIFVILGITGNILVCLAVALDKSLQTLSNFFLCSLAFTDLVISLVIIPVRCVILLYELKPTEFVWCVFYVVADNFLTGASAAHICSISLERYFAIKNPLNRAKISKSRTAKRVLMVWITSSFTVLPIVLIALTSSYPQSNSYCSDILAGWSFYNGILITEALVIVVMILVVGYSFVRTTMILYKLTKDQKNNNSGMIRSVGRTNKKNVNELKSLNSENKALRVVWLVSFAFVITLGPYAAVNICYLLTPSFIISPTFITIINYLNYTNSVINPILYTFFNKNFRDNFWHILTCRYKLVSFNRSVVIKV